MADPLVAVKRAYLCKLKGLLFNYLFFSFFVLWKNGKQSTCSITLIFFLILLVILDLFDDRLSLENDLIDKLHSLHDSSIDKNISNIANTSVEWKPLLNVDGYRNNNNSNNSNNSNNNNNSYGYNIGQYSVWNENDTVTTNEKKDNKDNNSDEDVFANYKWKLESNNNNNNNNTNDILDKLKINNTKNTIHFFTSPVLRMKMIVAPVCTPIKSHKSHKSITKYQTMIMESIRPISCNIIENSEFKHWLTVQCLSLNSIMDNLEYKVISNDIDDDIKHDDIKHDDENTCENGMKCLSLIKLNDAKFYQLISQSRRSIKVILNEIGLMNNNNNKQELNDAVLLNQQFEQNDIINNAHVNNKDELIKETLDNYFCQFDHFFNDFINVLKYKLDAIKQLSKNDCHVRHTDATKVFLTPLPSCTFVPF